MLVCENEINVNFMIKKSIILYSFSRGALLFLYELLRPKLGAILQIIPVSKSEIEFSMISFMGKCMIFWQIIRAARALVS